MKAKHLKYYETYSASAPLIFMLAGLFTRTHVRKLSAMNRHKDYMALGKTPELLPLHHAMNTELLRAAAEWDSYDYGEGYFYQGLDLVGITGLRNTRSRVDAMQLEQLVAGKTVLEIGCNSGFLSVMIAHAAQRVVGFDINPHLIKIGQLAAEHIGADNVELLVTSFEDYKEPEPFDVVLSFANHHTFDENTKQSIDDYIDRCHQATKPGGLLVFESHPPEHEGDGLPGVRACIERHYDITEERVLDHGTYLDRGRTFMLATRRD